jgi:hypothetical protein
MAIESVNMGVITKKWSQHELKNVLDETIQNTYLNIIDRQDTERIKIPSFCTRFLDSDIQKMLRLLKNLVPSAKFDDEALGKLGL